MVLPRWFVLFYGGVLLPVPGAADVFIDSWRILACFRKELQMT